MPSENNTAIVIVCYNNPTLLVHQIACIRKFCLDAYDIVVVDNSTDWNAISGIKYHAELGNALYIKTNARSVGGSESHAFAANVSYLQLKDKYEYFLYLDHDCFPIKNFSIAHTLGECHIAGIGQQKERTYFWPGCVMFKADEAIDFSCNNTLHLDTGGNLYKMIDKYGLSSCIFFNEAYHENDQYNGDSMYNFYTTINNDMFMHFVAASNWHKSSDNDERVNSLLNILQNRIA